MDDEEDASLFKLEAMSLMEMMDKDRNRFNRLDFSNCSTEWLNKLFPKPKSSNFGQLDPPASHRRRAHEIRQFRRTGAKDQEKLILAHKKVKEQEKKEQQRKVFWSWWRTLMSLLTSVMGAPL
jgi:hypothetical protein